MFHVAGPATEKDRLPNLVRVRTVVAALVISSGISCDKLS